MGKIKILAIDDDSSWHRLLKRIFEDTGCDIQAASSCEDGVKMARECSPDCILLDFHLKDGDAVAVCSALTLDGERPGFPVIVVSSDPDAEEAAYQECHADYFVLKGSRGVVELPLIVMRVLGNTDAPVP